MLQIAVVDDDELFLRDAAERIRHAAKEEVAVTCHASGDAFLEHYLAGEVPDILFLDIDMPGRDGMELSKLLREQENCPVIVFLTGHSRYVYDAFFVEAAGYLLKPLSEERLKEVLAFAIKKTGLAKGEVLHLKSGQDTVVVPVKDIYYIENQGRKLLFHTRAGETACYGKMETYEKSLPSYFFRCHRGYLVSLREVVSYDKNSIRLSNGETVLLAAKRRAAFLEACLAWME